MTLFEYMAVANSIILSFAAVRLLDAFPSALAPERRYGTHFAFLVVTVWLCAQYWWVSWTFSQITDWTYVKFLAYLVPPALLYSQARAIASEAPSQVESFRHHFDRVRKRFFMLLAAYLLALLLGGSFISGSLPSSLTRLTPLLGIVLALSGAMVGDRRYHSFLATAFLAILFVLTLFTYSTPLAPVE